MDTCVATEIVNIRQVTARGWTCIIEDTTTTRDAILFLRLAWQSQRMPRKCEPKLDIQGRPGDGVESASEPEYQRQARAFCVLHYSPGIEDSSSFFNISDRPFRIKRLPMVLLITSPMTVHVPSRNGFPGVLDTMTFFELYIS